MSETQQGEVIIIPDHRAELATQTDRLLLPSRHVPPPPSTRPPHVNRFQEFHRQVAIAKGEGQQFSSSGPRVKAEFVAMAERIKRARKDRGWTQTDFGSMVGVSTPYISQIETARCGLGNVAEKIFELLDIQP